jgi:hypothetical protein
VGRGELFVRLRFAWRGLFSRRRTFLGRADNVLGVCFDVPDLTAAARVTSKVASCLRATDLPGSNSKPAGQERAARDSNPQPPDP